MNKKKGLQGLDGLNAEYSINLENAKHLYLPLEELKNEVGNTVVKIECIGGKIRTYINVVHALRPNNIKPFGIADAIKLELVNEKVIGFIKAYLQKNLQNQYSDEYIDNLKVTNMECNLTIKCYGNATPSAIISLFDLAYDETGVRRKRKRKTEYEKINKSWVHYKPKEYKIKVYNKSMEQHEKGNPLVENNLLRIEVVFIDRSLKRMYGDNRNLSNILTKQSLEILCQEYKRVLTEDIIEKNIKPCLDYCVRENEYEAKKQGLEQLPIIPLHGLRHSCATLLNYLDINIIDISKILGHAKSSTTMDIYAHSFEKQNKEAANKLNDFIINSRLKQA